MDTITHAISGAVVGVATSGRQASPAEHRTRAAWGALFAAFPDSDVILVFFTDPLTLLNLHRGVTHSLVMLPVWALLLGWLASRLSKRPLLEMSLLAALSLLVHIFGDLITSYGTHIFAPFSATPYAFPITFIIDPIFTLILLVGLVIALWRKQAMPALASSVLLLAYLGMQTWASQSATAFGREYAAAQDYKHPIVVAFPQPLSPFNWMVVVATENGYDRSFINLLKKDYQAPAEDAGRISKTRAAYRPREQARWFHYPRWPDAEHSRNRAVHAWVFDGFREYRKFALLPYVSRVTTWRNRLLCFWTNDLRFSVPYRDAPFEYAVCRDERGQWQLLDTDAE